MQTIWDYSLESEAKRLIHCAHQMAVGFYRVNNFLVLPYPKTKNNLFTVSFPDLTYTTIKRFWDKAKKTDVHRFPIKVHKKYLQEVTKLLEDSHSFTEPSYFHIKVAWAKAEKEVLCEIVNLLPNTKGKIKDIIIHPTKFGTTVSFNRSKDNLTTVEMYIREDANIYEITEALLTHLTRPTVYDKYDGLWAESEIIVDFLIGETNLAKVLKKYSKALYLPTSKIIRAQQNAKLLAQSDMFYKKLGLPIHEKAFDIKNNKLFVTGHLAENLTERELTILKLLVTNSNKVTTFDEIYDALYKEDKEFSLWAIAKLMQRVRNKLEENGVSGSYIQTLRGQGYLLKN